MDGRETGENIEVNDQGDKGKASCVKKETEEIVCLIGGKGDGGGWGL